MGLRLYENNKYKDQKRERAKTETEEEKKPLVNLTTEKLIGMRKKQISRVVFDMLDTDFDDLLIMNQFCSDYVPIEMLKILNELFQYMKINFKEVEYFMFEQLFSQYYDTLTPTEKHMLLAKKQKKLFDHIDSDFKPKLNANSLKMAIALKKVPKHSVCKKEEEVYDFKPKINK